MQQLAARFKGKLIANSARNCYDQDVLDNCDRVECVLKKFTILQKHSNNLFNSQADGKITLAGKHLAIYASQTMTPTPSAYLRTVASALENMGAKCKEINVKLTTDVSFKLNSWLIANQKTMEAKMKQMEELRKDMQTKEKAAASSAEMATGAEYAKEAWKKECEDTLEAMKKFLSNASELKKYADAWIEKENALDVYNRGQCEKATAGNTSKGKLFAAPASDDKDEEKKDDEEKKEEEEE